MYRKLEGYLLSFLVEKYWQYLALSPLDHPAQNPSALCVNAPTPPDIVFLWVKRGFF